MNITKEELEAFNTLCDVNRDVLDFSKDDDIQEHLKHLDSLQSKLNGWSE